MRDLHYIGDDFEIIVIWMLFFISIARSLLVVLHDEMQSVQTRRMRKDTCHRSL